MDLATLMRAVSMVGGGGCLEWGKGWLERMGEEAAEKTSTDDSVGMVL